MIEITKLTKRFRTKKGEVIALDGVDLQIERGEFVNIIGPSGVGKSTLLHIIAGLLTPTTGNVAIEGEKLFALDSAKRSAFRAANIGFIFQMFHLVGYLNVLDNVLLGASDDEAAERANEWLEELGIGDRVHHRPRELSVGQQQRVAVARAMVADPKLILADEPTASLDRENEVAIFRVLQTFQEGGGTVVMVSHSDAAESVASRTIEMAAGRIAHAAPVASTV